MDRACGSCGAQDHETEPGLTRGHEKHLINEVAVPVRTRVVRRLSRASGCPAGSSGGRLQNGPTPSFAIAWEP